jgi:hypothetical protein
VLSVVGMKQFNISSSTVFIVNLSGEHLIIY